MLAGALPDDRSRRTPRTRPTASRWCSPTRCGSTELPGPPPTALVANLPYNVSVPVLLHLLALLPSLERGLVMVQSEVADRLAAAPGSQGLRHPVGQGRLVRRRTPGRRDRPQRLLAGAQRRLRPGRLDPPRAADHDRDPRAGLRGRRRGVRPPPQDAARRAARRSPARPRPSSAALARAGIDPLARGEPLDVDDFVRIAEALRPMSGRMTRSPCARRRRSTCTSASAPRARTASTRWRPSTRRSACTTTSPSTHADDWSVDVHRSPTGSTPPTCRSTATTSSSGPRALLAAHHGVDRPRRRRTSTRTIPVAGGLAGGTADAAAALVALRPAVGRCSTTDEDLLALAAQLGSDVPFALVGGTALGTGRGELVEPVTDARHLVVGGRAVADGLSTPGGLPPVRPAVPGRARADPECPPTRCSPRSPTGDAARARRRAAQRPAGRRRSTCAPTSRELIEAGRGAPARCAASSPAPARPACSSAARADQARATSPPTLPAPAHAVVLVATGPVAGAHAGDRDG